MQENKSIKRLFASDNCSGVHSNILNAITSANNGHVISYGDDPFTEKLKIQIKALFGQNAEVYPVFSGTGANVTALQACIRSFEAVICTDVAHIYVDECGAPEKFLQAKLITVPHNQGKLTIDQIEPLLHAKGFEHHVQPKVISITQSSEYGTVYTPEEIGAICDFAHRNEMLVHMDGARLSNAASSLGIPFKVFTTDCGVDILSLGGTKNGMLQGEAVVVLNSSIQHNLKYIRKQAMQLGSKMRYTSAQFLAWFKDDLYLQLAAHSNQMAQYLASKLERVDGVILTQPVQANAVFAILPQDVYQKLISKGFFYEWNAQQSEYRFMCSWDTQVSDIDELLAGLF
ncbi:MAG: threonine aldolase family protein [Flavobacteriales bacterium]